MKSTTILLFTILAFATNSTQSFGWNKNRMTINTTSKPSLPNTSSNRTERWPDDSIYSVGVGMADMTGPAAEVNMMGYAKFGQDTSGIHFRLFARSFVIEDNRGSRIVYIACDIGMIDQAVKTAVSKTLSDMYGYSRENILISGSHTHSGPGGFLQYLLYTIVSQGFTKKTFDAVVSGIVKSVTRAHSNMRHARIYWNEGQLLNASVNRSPSAYLNNSLDERQLYSHDTDKDMYLLKFVDIADNKPMGMLNWFAVHPTSMNNTNSLISGDNKGYASLLTEMHFNGKDCMPGKGSFVAAFANANLGDVSPNLNGPKCMDSGLSCDGSTSTCNGKSEMCVATGPGKDMFESTEIIGRRQAIKAIQLFEEATQVVRGPVAFVYKHVDMSRMVFKSPITGETVKTCKPAMGYSFAAGTTDGPGAFDFKQGTTSGNRFWNFVRDFIAKPNQELIECHAPKPILLATGIMTFPYPWQPTILPFQMLRVGNVLMAGVPSELTTMSGRRLKNFIRKEASQVVSDTKVVIAGLSNAYSSYVTTFEEYQVQRYEGASTIYGPHTLEAYISEFTNLTQALLANITRLDGPEPPLLLSKQLSLRPGVVFDYPVFKHKFGDVLLQPDDVYQPGMTVTTTFVSAHPQNNLMLDNSYLTVERKNSQDWTVVSTDSSLDTKFIWKRTNPILGQSISRIEWTVPEDAKSGLYRIRHFGTSKSIFQHLSDFEGTSKTFQVVPQNFTSIASNSLDDSHSILDNKHFM